LRKTAREALFFAIVIVISAPDDPGTPMHDIRLIREQPTAFDAALARRGLPAAAPEILALDEARRTRIAAAEQALADRNAASREVGAAKARGDEAEFERLRSLVADKKDEIARLEAEAAAADAALRELLLGIPNLPYDDVPDGPDETANVEIHRWGAPRNFATPPLEHFEVPAARAGLDFEAAARLSGSRFVVMKGAMTRLHRALAQFMIDTHVEKHGLTEVWTPVLVRDEAMLGTGQLPKFADQSYRTENGWWLIPTAEVTLTNLVADRILDEAELPIRMTAHTQCFRSEAGSAGKDTAGMLRHHQFEKVEMVSITRPEDSRAEHERMTACAQAILEALGLPYRTVVLSTGDMGFSVRRTHDLEVWLPGQDAYREISSVSDCGDFQARRMNARFRRGEGARPEFVHTLNGSGLAVGRTLIAVIENGQEPDGSITLPPALAPYLGGRTRVDPDGRLA
jgi:seryl-tRNA synthetase